MRPLPPPITLTPAAIAYIERITQAQPESAGLRVALKSSGCSGYKYQYALAQAADINPLDRIVACGTTQVIIDFKAEPFLIGAVLDYKETALQAGLEFSNPNEAARCGCGESFTPKA